MGPAACHAGCDAVTRLDVRRPALRHTLVRQPAPARRAGLTWPRLPPAAKAAITGAGYLAHALVRLGVPAGRHAAFAHAAELGGGATRGAPGRVTARDPPRGA